VQDYVLERDHVYECGEIQFGVCGVDGVIISHVTCHMSHVTCTVPADSGKAERDAERILLFVMISNSLGVNISE
jgi:hypothetical protein